MAARRPPSRNRTKKKPTWASVTTRPCKCKFLEGAAAEPTIPIVFDARMNEFHIQSVGKERGGHSVIYHCPFCGGAAPPSKRGSLFATITSAEARRLTDLASGIRTIQEAIERFGKPDHDFDRGMTVRTPDSDTEPPKVVSYRLLRYDGLSKTAVVQLIDEGPDRGVRLVLMGKYLGAPKT